MDNDYYKEVSDDVKAVLDLTSRVDERVKMLIDRQVQLDLKMETLSRVQMELSTKVGVLETRKDDVKIYKELDEFHSLLRDHQREMRTMDSRLMTVESSSTSSEQRWRSVFTFVRDTIWVVLVCYLLYKLNLQTPPLP